jgi:hypothetical protein
MFWDDGQMGSWAYDIYSIEMTASWGIFRF